MGTELSRSTLRMIIILFAALALCAQFAAGPPSADAQTTITEEKPKQEPRTGGTEGPAEDPEKDAPTELDGEPPPPVNLEPYQEYLDKGYTFRSPRIVLAVDPEVITVFAPAGKEFIRLKGYTVKVLDEVGRQVSMASIKKDDPVGVLRKGRSLILAIFPKENER